MFRQLDINIGGSRYLPLKTFFLTGLKGTFGKRVKLIEGFCSVFPLTTHSKWKIRNNYQDCFKIMETTLF